MMPVLQQMLRERGGIVRFWMLLQVFLTRDVFGTKKAGFWICLSGVRKGRDETERRI